MATTFCLHTTGEQMHFARTNSAQQNPEPFHQQNIKAHIDMYIIAWVLMSGWTNFSNCGLTPFSADHITGTKKLLELLK